MLRIRQRRLSITTQTIFLLLCPLPPSFPGSVTCTNLGTLNFQNIPASSAQSAGFQENLLEIAILRLETADLKDNEYPSYIKNSSTTEVNLATY